MQCPLCNNVMFIKENITKITGDTSPDEPTVVKVIPLYCCLNEQCEANKEKQIINGEPTVTYDGSKPAEKVEIKLTAKQCCGEVIAFIDDNTFSVPKRTDNYSKHSEVSNILEIKCPICSRMHTFGVKGKHKA